jgi:alkylation response protein AidB-like acyl-CoA dehydrogenase
MFIDLTPEQHALRIKVRDYFNNLMAGDLKLRMRGAEGGEEYRNLLKTMGRDGWLALGWPKEFGGQGYGPTEQLIFFEEALIAGAPLPFVTINTVGPTLMVHGTEEQKKKYLPGIASGDIVFAIGYSEPGAGTDLATLKTTAQVHDDKFVVNGNKLWTSGSEAADYIWLAARTDPDLPRHKGISIIILDTKTPGFSHTVIKTLSNPTAATYYDNVEVPRANLVGQLHGGWKLITEQLNHERLGLGAYSDKVTAQFKRVLAWAKAPDENGQRAIELPWVQRSFAQCYSRLEAMRLINFRIAQMLEDNNLGLDFVALASATKVYGSEGAIEILKNLQEIVGAAGMVQTGSAAARLQGEIEYETRAATTLTFGGGVNELQRELVAQFGIGMPRPGR